MNNKHQEAIIHSRVNIQDIVEHKKMFGIPDSKTHLQLMTDVEYAEMLGREAFFFVDHDRFLRHQFSGEIMAANKEQLDILIRHLESLRHELDTALDCTRE